MPYSITSFIILLLSHYSLLHKEILVKLILITCVYELIFYIALGDKLKLYKLSALRNSASSCLSKYKISNKRELTLSVSYVLSYISIFIFGILYLRFLNKTHEMNLLEKISQLKKLATVSSPLDLTLSTVIILLILILIIVVHKNLLKNFKHHLKKLHIFFTQKENYLFIFLNTSSFPYPPIVKLNNYSISRIFHFFGKTIEEIAYLLKIQTHSPWEQRQSFHINSLSKWDHFSFKTSRVIWQVLQYLHYLILVSIILLDISLHSFTLKNYFYFLPFFFLYYNWLRYSKTIDGINVELDHRIMLFIYTNWTMIDNELYSEKGDPFCSYPEGVQQLIEYCQNDFAFQPFLNMYTLPTGKISIAVNKILKVLSSLRTYKKLKKLLSRKTFIKIHKVNLSILRKIIYLIFTTLLLWLLINCCPY